MAAPKSRGKGTSPYFGVHKRGDKYVADMRHGQFKKFCHRTADELEAAFFIDAINHIFPNKTNYSYNLVNGQRVLTECRSQYQDLQELVVTHMEQKSHVPQEIRNTFVRVVEDLWKTYREDILKDHARPSSRQTIQGECSIEKETGDIWRNTDNQGLSAKFDVDGGLVLRAPMELRVLKKYVLLPPALEEHQGANSDNQIIQHEGECSIEKETSDIWRNTDNQGLSAKFDVDWGFVLRAPMELRVLKKYVLLPPALQEHQGANSDNQIIQHEGECSIEKETSDIWRNTDNQGLSVKFDVNGGLVLRAPMEEGALKKYVLLPPGLEEHQVSNSDNQIIQHEGIDGSSAMSRESVDNMEPHMKIRCAEYKNYLKAATKFLASSCSQARASKFLFPETDPMLRLCESLHYTSKLGGPAWMHIDSQQMSQCAVYEQIYDIVSKFVDSECPPEEINRFQAETGPIIQRCRANWHY